MNQLEIIASQKGGQKLLLNGYSFTVKTKSVHTIRWECSERKSQQCVAKLTTKKDDNSITSQTPHSHAGNPAKIAVLKQKLNLKRKIQESAITGCSKQAAISESLSNLTPSDFVLFKKNSYWDFA